MMLQFNNIAITESMAVGKLSKGPETTRAKLSTNHQQVPKVRRQRAVPLSQLSESGLPDLPLYIITIYVRSPI